MSKDGCVLIDGYCHNLKMADAKSGEIFPTNEKRPPGNERIESSKNNWMSGRRLN